MYSLILKFHDPFFNLAAEEYLLHNRIEDFFILSINDPSVIIGKHQVAPREANVKFITEKEIPLIRRISGGGTVYHDNGNLNFAFIKQSETGKQIDFKLYIQQIINFLSSLGIEAKSEAKNDITIDGLKVSGNAEHVYKDRVLHHGTLLFDASLENLKMAIKDKTGSYTTRAVESNRTPVVNLKNKLKNISDIYEFESVMLNFFNNSTHGVTPFSLSVEEESEIMSLAESKYRTWEWNYAYGPRYAFVNRFEVGGEPHICRMLVKDGIIWECSIEGSNEMIITGKKLIGCKHMYDDLLKIFQDNNLPVSGEQVFNFF
jgi:lipoate-protein ligase A